MPLINCKVELKLKWTKYYVFSAAGKDNTNDNPNNYYFYYQRHKIICSCCNFVSARDKPKLSKLLSKGFEGSIYWNEYKTKRENKNTPNEYRYFLEPNLVGVNRLFELAYLKRNNDIQPLKTQRYYLKKGIIVYYNVIVNGKNVYGQPIDSNIKQYDEIRKLTTGQGEDYTTGCLLDYEYIKNHYRLIAVDLSGKKELDANPKQFNK